MRFGMNLALKDLQMRFPEFSDGPICDIRGGACSGGEPSGSASLDSLDAPDGTHVRGFRVFGGQEPRGAFMVDPDATISTPGNSRRRGPPSESDISWDVPSEGPEENDEENDEDVPE